MQMQVWFASQPNGKNSVRVLQPLLENKKVQNVFRTVWSFNSNDDDGPMFK